MENTKQMPMYHSGEILSLWQNVYVNQARGEIIWFVEQNDLALKYSIRRQAGPFIFDCFMVCMGVVDYEGYFLV